MSYKKNIKDKKIIVIWIYNFNFTSCSTNFIILLNFAVIINIASDFEYLYWLSIA